MTARYLIGDVLEVAKTLEPGSVDLVVSSPPFLAVRSYLPADHPDKTKEGGQQSTPGGYIDWLIDVVEALGPCLAPHGSLVFELGDTYAGSGGAGGDYQEAGLRNGQPVWDGSARRNAGADSKNTGNTSRGTPSGNGWPRAKSKSLIPELFRLALTYGLNPLTGRTTDRWILRNVITWCRPNPTPGALGDKVRPATSDIAVLTKSGKRWFDLDAERHPNLRADEYRPRETLNRGAPGYHVENDSNNSTQNPAGAPLLDWWELPPEEPARQSKSHARTAKGVESVPRSGKSADRGGNWSSMAELHETREAPLLDWWELPPEEPAPDPVVPGGKYDQRAGPNTSRNDLGRSDFGGRDNGPPLDFWVLPPGGYSGAHYAVWPPELVRRLISLMCPLRVCRVCGEPSRRMVGEPEYVPGPNYGGVGRRKPHPLHLSQGGDPSTSSTFKIDGSVIRTTDTLGWSDCGHDNWREGMVLDPFVGSGTTLAVASGMGRDSIGIDLDERNLELARQRVGMFLQ